MGMDKKVSCAIIPKEVLKLDQGPILGSPVKEILIFYREFICKTDRQTTCFI